MEILDLPSGTPREMGQAHGEQVRAGIHELTQIRIGLALEAGNFGSEARLLEIAAAHVPLLASYDRLLHEEFMGIVEGADLDPAKLVVLNHYTDLKDIDAEDCTTLTANTPEGPLLGQTWDMHGSAEPFVCLLRIPEVDGRPAVHSFTLHGCLALAGLNAHGLGVTINNLKSRDAKVGVLWPALVRRMLAEDNTHAAKHVLMTAPMSSGHHYLFGDGQHGCAVETSGERKATTFEVRWDDTPDAAYAHTNHCLDEGIGEVSWVSEWSTSYERFAWIEKSLGESPLSGNADMWSRLGSHDGYPASLCTHLATEEAPHKMKTCGAITMDLRQRTLHAVKGCANDVSPAVFGFEKA
ncbi:MAG: C45 family autoproteolytic acyltransferase/hydrolase [Sandaracinaceae bacterium]